MPGPGRGGERFCEYRTIFYFMITINIRFLVLICSLKMDISITKNVQIFQLSLKLHNLSLSNTFLFLTFPLNSILTILKDTVIHLEKRSYYINGLKKVSSDNFQTEQLWEIWEPSFALRSSIVQSRQQQTRIADFSCNDQLGQHFPLVGLSYQS